jgi:fucose permease
MDSPATVTSSAPFSGLAGRRWPVWPYLAAFFGVGVAVTFAGPALSHLRDRVGTNDGGIALIFVGQSLGYMAGSFVGGRILDRGLGHRLWPVCLLISLVTIGVIAQLHSLGAMVAVFAVLGVAGGAGDVSGNTLVVWSRPDSPGSALNALHLFFALGALSSPLLTNRAIAWSHSLWPLVVPLAALALVVGTRLWITPSPPKVVAHDPLAEPGNKPAARGRHLFVLAAFFFVYVMFEIGFANWVHSYVEQIGYGDANTATGVTATFWVGFSIGRLASIWLARRFSPGWMLTVSMAVALVASTAMLVFNDGDVALWIVTFVFGVSIAPQFASMVGYAGTHFALSGAATSAFIAAAGLAGLVMPWSLGQLFDAHGPRVLPPVTFAACIATVAAALVVHHIVHVAERPGGQRPPLQSMNAPVT